MSEEGRAGAPPHGEGPSGRPLPLSVRLLGVGVKGARSVGKATGIDRAVEVAAEEAMVAAVESEAVERAIARVLQGPAVEEAMNGVLESDAVKKALVEALDSDLVDEVWRRLLASDEAQRLVERIAEAPEIRAAISAQSVGLIQDVGHTIGKVTRRLDGVVERFARRILFRPRRSEPTERAGAVTRGLALGIDALFVNLAFSGLAALTALIVSGIFGNDDGVPAFVLAAGTGIWLILGALYFVGFWSLAAQTPGMRFVSIRLGVDGRGLPPRRSFRRLVGFALAAIPFGIGFLGILFDERRRGWQDRLSEVDVVYEVNEPTPAPWSSLEPAETVAGTAAAASRSGASPSGLDTGATAGDSVVAGLANPASGT